MKSYRALLTVSTLAMTLGIGTTARAEDELALSFDLEPASVEDAAVEEPVAVAAAPPPDPAPNWEDAPLPIPLNATTPPLSSDNARPSGVYGGVDALAIGTAASVQALLPPPPPAIEPMPVAATIAPIAEPDPVPELGIFPKEEVDDLLALNLDLKPRAKEKPETSTGAAIASAEPEPSPVAKTWNAIESIFTGGSDSLVARAVGSAEGTRTPEGHKNPAYFGHVDPGNGVWNMGTFSYQHGATTPEEADKKQLLRLQKQTKVLQAKAAAKGIALTPAELLNGIDLANQAPLAALDRGGYIDWLEEAQKLGMEGDEAIVWARTRSFIDPDTQRWNAPGLGNNIYSIHHDQERRANAIARAMNASGAVIQVAEAIHPTHDEAVIPDPEPVAVKPALNIALDLSLNKPFEQAPVVASAIAANAQTEAAQSPEPEVPEAEIAPTRKVNFGLSDRADKGETNEPLAAATGAESEPTAIDPASEEAAQEPEVVAFAENELTLESLSAELAATLSESASLAADDDNPEPQSATAASTQAEADAAAVIELPDDAVQPGSSDVLEALSDQVEGAAIAAPADQPPDLEATAPAAAHSETKDDAAEADKENAAVKPHSVTEAESEPQQSAPSGPQLPFSPPRVIAPLGRDESVLTAEETDADSGSETNADSGSETNVAPSTALDATTNDDIFKSLETFQKSLRKELEIPFTE